MNNCENLAAKYGEWALVVGASTGLGEAWAMECAKRGFNVIICARRMEKLQEVSKRIRDTYNVETKEFVCDISKEDAPDIIMNATEDLDIGMCIYNAAIETGGYFIKVDEKYHRQQIIGNAQNPMLVSYHMCRKMAKKHRGCILLISSMAGIVGIANQAVYGGCKSFMSILGESLWYEMAKYGVYVAGVTVGTIATPNFYAQQEQQGTGLDVGQEVVHPDYGFDVSTLDPAIYSAVPHAPETVAEYVLDRVGTGPRLFTYDDDEASYNAYQRETRERGVTVMSKGTDMYFSAYTEYNAPDADEFVQIKE